MPQISRKRARPAPSVPEPVDGSASESVSSADSADEVQQQPTRRQRRRSSSEPEVDDVSGPEDGAAKSTSTVSQQQLTKNLVRLALSSEYARVPIRRSDISQKVLQPANAGRMFRAVFDDAQLALRRTFGMEMVELPAREKVTVAQRRQAQKSQSTQTGGGSSNPNKQWILRSVLPEEYRAPDIITPSKAPTEEVEASYIGLYSFLVSVIALSGGSINEARLEQLLQRTNADETTPVDKRDKVIARMVKEGYIIKVRETSGGEETVDYMLGPRGKVEVADGGVAGMVRKVFRKGEQGTTAEEDEELERRIERSLKVNAAASGEQQRVSGTSQNQTNGAAEPKRRGRPRRNQDDESDD